MFPRICLLILLYQAEPLRLRHAVEREVKGLVRVTRDAHAAVFSVKQISPFSSSEFPIVIVGKSPLSAGLVRKHVPLLHPAA